MNWTSRNSSIQYFQICPFVSIAICQLSNRFHRKYKCYKYDYRIHYLDFGQSVPGKIQCAHDRRMSLQHRDNSSIIPYYLYD